VPDGGSRTRASCPAGSPWVGRSGGSVIGSRCSSWARLGFTQLAALYILADGEAATVAELADALGRSPSATSRLVDGLVRRSLVERRIHDDDRRRRGVVLARRGTLLVAVADRARAAQFLSIVRPLTPAERAVVAMGVAALASRAVTRRGRLIKSPEPTRG
jgi:DNA-binding MarR family transcriptional regulator